jgi:hypothetical protein
LLSSAKGPMGNPCLRNELSPISQEGHPEFGDFAMTGAEAHIPRAFADAEIGDRLEWVS